MQGTQYIGAKGFLFEVDADQLILTPTNTPDWQAINTVTTSEAFNEEVSTFFNHKENGVATNVVVGIDPQYDLTFRYALDDIIGNDISALRHGTERRLTCRITDVVNGDTVQFIGSITSFSSPRDVNDVIEMSMTIKILEAYVVT